MNDIDSDLQLHLKLNEKIVKDDGFEIHDYSGHEKHAVVTGDPMVVADEHLGSCLLFNEGDSLLVEGLEGFEQPGPYTVAVWIKSKAPSQDILTKSITDDLSWLLVAVDGPPAWVWNLGNQQSGLLMGVASESKPISDDHWHHLAVTMDKHGNMTAFQDGAYTGSYQGDQPQDFGSTGKLQIGTQNLDYKFTGKMAHLRIYSRCLSSDEIQECISADKTALAAFRTMHPIEFNLVNKETLDPVLYITSDNNVSAASKDTQTLLLEVTNTSDTDFTFGNTDSSNAGKEHYHFQLQFRPNTLSNAAIDLLRRDDSILKTQAWAQGWDIHYDPDKDDLVDWISFLWIGLDGGISRISSCMENHTEEADYYAMLEKQYKNGKTLKGLLGGDFSDQKLPTKSTVRIEFTGISAGAGGGTRATRVYLHYQNLEQSDQGTLTKILPGSRSQTLEIINRLGKERIPLHVGFVGSHSILNDGTPNKLILRITNLTNKPLSLYTGDPEKKPKFRLSFDYQDPSHVSDDESGQWERHWAIGKTEVALSINITPTEDDQERWFVSGVQDAQEPRPYWRIEPKENNIAFNAAETVEFLISNIMTTAPTGVTNLYVEYKNIPGYWDGEFVLPLEKGPLVHRTHSFPSSGDHPDGKQTLQFNGENDSIEVAEVSIPNQGTIEAWIYLDENGGSPKGWSGIAVFGTVLIMALHDEWLFLRYQTENEQGYADLRAAEKIPLGRWVHVAGSWSQPDDARVYVNGVEKGIINEPLKLNDADTMLGIGNYNSAFFKGRIARVSLWNWPQNAESIKKHMNLALEGGSLSSGDENLIGYWTLDSSNSAPDVARPPYHPGVIKGSPVLVLPKDDGFMNTGIGTDTPHAKLHVSVKTENGKVHDEDKEPAAVFEGGKVGIGTAKPTADLDVTGKVKAVELELTGMGTVQGDLQVSGAITGALNGANINNSSIALDKLVEAVQQALCPVGAILPYAGDTAPPGWLMCNTNSGYDPNAYPKLFAVIEYRFGGFTQNNIHYFLVPDLRGYFLRGRDGGVGRDPDRASRTAINSEGAIGDKVGSYQKNAFVLHTHSASATADGSHSHQILYRGFETGGDARAYVPDNQGPDSTIGHPSPFAGSHTHTITVQSVGGSETRPDNMYVNYIIKC